MSETYRTTELANAKNEQAKARTAYESQPKFNKAKREAAEQLEFWGNKVAFLSNANLTK